jgi:signal peptidase I
VTEGSSCIAGYVALALLAVLLWPQRWGGTMTYDITHGTSMQPTFQTGDLAILRKAGSYHVGEVAAYRSPSLHTTVMHRIQTKTARGYTFKGDHNNFVDPDTVPDKAMLGRLLFRVPGVGRFLLWFVNPLHLALAIGGVALLLSDRRDKGVVAPPPATGASSGAAGPPLVVRITSLRLPQEVATADVESPSDMERLAAMYSLAILRDDTCDYVLHTGMLFRHVRRQQLPAPQGRRRSQQGRDWAYVPAPTCEVVQLDDRRPVPA